MLRPHLITPLAALTLALTVLPLHAQPDTLWTRTFGGNEDDYSYSLQHTTDGGFAILGWTYSYGAGSKDVWLIKTDSNGREQWNRTFGTLGHETGNSVQETTDGGFIIVGSRESIGNWIDIWLIKTDREGHEEWNYTYGRDGEDYGYDVQQVTDGGFIIIGRTVSLELGDYNAFLIKTNENGREEWNRTFGGEDDDWGYSVKQTTDGGFVITGLTSSYGAGSYDVWLIKTDNEGREIWSRTFGGATDDIGYNVQEATEGGYILVGSTQSFGAGRSDIWLIRTDADGDSLWSRTFGGRIDDGGYYVQQTIDQRLVISGWTNSFGEGNRDYWLVKTEADGDSLWSRTYGGNDNDFGRAVQQTNDGRFALAGYTYSFGMGRADVWLIKTTSDQMQPTRFNLLSPSYGDSLDTWEWNFTWEQSIDYNEEDTVSYLLSIGTNFSFQAIALSDTNITVNSDTLWLLYPEYYEPVEWWVLALSGEDTTECNAHFTFTPVPNAVDDKRDAYPTRFELYPPTPNPFNSTTTIIYGLDKSAPTRVALYDLSGREVRTLVEGNKQAGVHRAVLNAEDISSGLYFVRMEAGEFTQARKVMLVR